ncbi:hypothetical protein V562_05756 [Pseudomonas aeruginosa PS75]|nr:hypothetical protein PA7790_06464 [Pseudomonas aeruginosa]ERY99862.1 hypothetical protein Q020_06260 [Pseudomonas aeruginosa BWHPSA007]EVT82401.1 hypothetical protein Z046_32675 [Pseudomonas aeruginosa VRFPA09]EZO40848.1 hypothetical protein V562_05756 [Pseudomonas aeruginosa PS75]KSD15567.1 hypothetical protein AO898_23425 [Pseudomonas aeruginosa]
METRAPYLVQRSEPLVREVCLRTFESGWIPPSAAEVLAVMRLADLEPRDAAVVLGGLSRREVNRWTTGQDEIPYACWVLLCQRAKLAYREQPDAQSTNVPGSQGGSHEE